MTTQSDSVSAAAPAPALGTTTSMGAAGSTIVSSTTELAMAPSLAFKEFQQLPEVTPLDILERPVKIDTFTITTTSAGPTVVHSFDPWALYLANSAVSAKMANIAYLRGELELEIVSTTAPSVYGVVDVSLVATCGAPSLYTNLHPFNSRQMTVAHVDLSLANSVRITVPWLWYYDYAALPAGPAAAWTVAFTTLHTIETGIVGGAVEARFTTYARLLPGASFGVARFQGKGRLESWKEHAKRASSFVEERTKGFPRDGPVSSVASTISNVAGKLEGIPVIGGAASLAKAGASAVAGIAAFFGYSRDPEPLAVMGVRTYALDNPGATELADHGLPTTLLGTGLLDPDPALVSGSEDDVLAFASISARPGYVAGASFTAAAVVGAQVLKLPVTPFFVPSYSGDVLSTLHLTPAGFCGLPFSFWRGDLVFHVDVIAPTTARGALQIAWQPPSSWSSDPTNVTHSKIVEYNGYTRFEFLVGYAREVPFLPVEVIRDDTPIVPVGNANGFVTITVVNPPLMVNPNNSVYVRVWVSAGKNIDFRTPASSVTILHSEGTTRLALTGNGFRYQGGPGPLGGSDSDFLPEQLELVPSSGSYPADTVNFPGAGVFSARAMVQKATAYRFSLAVDMALTPGVQEWEIRGPQMRTTSEVGWATNGCGMGFNYAAYYTSLFVGWSGAQHYSWHSWNPTSVAMSVVTATSPGVFSAYYPPGATANSTGPNGAVSYIIPYSSRMRFYPTAGAEAAWPDLATLRVRATITPNPAAGVTGVPGPGGSGAARSGVWYHSYGSDFRVSQFRQVPILFFELEGNGRNAEGSRAPTFCYFGEVSAP